MNVVEQDHVELFRLAANRLPRHDRRVFIAEVTLRLCEGNARQAEEQFGWGRETIKKGLQELQQGTVIADQNVKARGPVRSEDRNSQLARDIREIVEPRTQADPELKSSRRYTNFSASEVRHALIHHHCWSEQDVPSERTLRTILKCMNYRIKRIQKGRPLKKTENKDAIFENVQVVKAASRADPETLEISADTKAKVAIGDYSHGGKNTDRL